MAGCTAIKAARNRVNADRTKRNEKIAMSGEWPEQHERAMKKCDKTKPRRSATSGVSLF